MKKLSVSIAVLILLLLLLAGLAITINSFSGWDISTADLSTTTAGESSSVEDQHSSYLAPSTAVEFSSAEDQHSSYLAPSTAVVFSSVEDQHSSHLDPSNGGHAATGVGSPGDAYTVTERNSGLWDSAGNHVDFGSASADTDHPTSAKVGSKIDDTTSFSHSNIGTDDGAQNTDTPYAIPAKLNINDVFDSSPNVLINDVSLPGEAIGNDDWIALDIPAQTVPTPSGLILFSLGLLGLGLKRKTT